MADRYSDLHSAPGMSTSGPAKPEPTDLELGTEFLDAFGEAADARLERDRTLSATGFYDPCGDIERHLDSELHEKLLKLVKSIRAIK